MDFIINLLEVSGWFRSHIMQIRNGQTRRPMSVMLSCQTHPICQLPINLVQTKTTLYRPLSYCENRVTCFLRTQIVLNYTSSSCFSCFSFTCMAKILNIPWIQFLLQIWIRKNSKQKNIFLSSFKSPFRYTKGPCLLFNVRWSPRYTSNDDSWEPYVLLNNVNALRELVTN